MGGLGKAVGKDSGRPRKGSGKTVGGQGKAAIRQWEAKERQWGKVRERQERTDYGNIRPEERGRRPAATTAGEHAGVPDLKER